MSDANHGSQPAKHSPNSFQTRWRRRIHQIKRYFQEQHAKREGEDPEVKAARNTARATVIIAAFTVALAYVAWLQYQEVQDSSDSLDRMNRIYRAQAGQLARQAGESHDLAIQAKNQADRTKDMADRMKDQADRTKTIAEQAVIQAKAAKSAAQTADKSLHISERAYVIIGLPTLDTTIKYIAVPVLNTGHIPSGRVVATVHEVTIDHVDIKNRTKRITPTEAHWKHYEFASIPTSGQVMNFNVPVPALDIDSLNGGREQIILVGIISYSDGFADDPAQQWPFCEGSAMLPTSKTLQWALCDPNMFLPNAITADHYPDNEDPN